MMEQVTQRELRNNSGRIMEGLRNGHSYIITRRHEPVGELRPLRRRRLVDSRAVAEAFSDAPPIDAARLRADIDAATDQDIGPYA